MSQTQKSPGSQGPPDEPKKPDLNGHSGLHHAQGHSHNAHGQFLTSQYHSHELHDHRHTHISISRTDRHSHKLDLSTTKTHSRSPTGVRASQAGMRKSNVELVKSGRETQRETSEKKKTAQVPMQENKEMLQECFERICLMAMENERLFNKAGRSDDEVLEKKRELEIYKGRCDNLEKSRQFDSVNEERLIHLRHERDKLDASLRNANQEIDTLKNKIFDMDMNAANNQTLESDLRRA